MDAMHTLFTNWLDVGLAAGAVLTALCLLRGAYLVLAGGSPSDQLGQDVARDERWRARVWREYLRLPSWERARVLEVTRVIQTLDTSLDAHSNKEPGNGCD